MEMREKIGAYVPEGTVVILTLGVAVVFRSLLQKPQDVVPLCLVPAFFYISHVADKAGPRLWLAATTAITVLLALLYALP
jgi:hypothetical protein